MARVITIPHSPDFDRIAGLPRRRITDEDAAAWAHVFTEELRRPGSIATLRPGQGISIAEAVDNLQYAGVGAWLGLPVGVGKTIISALLPAVAGAERALIIQPATLVEKTWRAFAKLARDWKLSPHPVTIKSWHWLTTDAAQDFLNQLRPDAIIVDESDELSRPSNAATARIDRYVRQHETVRVYAMTGTPGRSSILDYWHIMCWCLRDRAPLPMRQADAKMLAAAIDYKTREPSNRPRPGPWGTTIAQAREWYNARLLETPGVVLLDGDSCDQPLTLKWRVARDDKCADGVFEDFLKDFETPGGEVVTDPLSRWRLDGHLGLGLYSRYVTPPPVEFVQARRNLGAFVRDRIARSARSDKPLDTEGQVLRRFADHPIVVEWMRVRDTPLETETIWYTDGALLSALEWLRESSEPGVVWCGSVDFGKALAKAAKLEYYGPKGLSLTGVNILDAPEDRSFIASWFANKKGLDLQAWRRNLVAMPPQSAKWLEQLFGRAHRQGQDRPVVFEILITSGGTIDAFEAAIGEASFGKETFGLTQKILRAEIQRNYPKITASNKYRWATRTKKDE
jgi:hypothetical protein